MFAPEIYCPACGIMGRMSLILLYEPQLSERLVSTWVKHQLLCIFVRTAGSIPSMGTVQNVSQAPLSDAHLE